MSSDFGIPTPPASESSDGKDHFFIDNLLVSERDVEKDSSSHVLTAPPSVHDNTDGSDEPSSPTSPDPVIQSGSRYLIHNSFLPAFIPQVAAAHQIKIPDSHPLSSCIPLRSPNRDDVESDPDSIPSMSLHDKLSGPSAFIIHRPLLLPDIIKSISQARRSKMRSRPVTRAKNKRESQELELLKLTGLDHIIDSPDNNGSIKNVDDLVTNSSRRTAAINNNQKFLQNFSTSQLSRSNQISTNGGEKQSIRSSSHNGSLPYYRNSNQRRASMSVSSLSSIPTSELSDYDLNSDNFGDDEDDPDFAPPTKKRKGDHSPSKCYPGSSSTLHMTHRRETGNKTKVCASCRTRSTPCWRPGWQCRYIPLKSEYNAMFKKPKNGDSPDLKRCCKCSTVL
ncbi:11068_t:CDS:2 [Dentiscutata heterogama]|uniref:11068_t:CDS:1 n=1 Tax=Dentiscutata heterogama TaxID=1316150 RepID=A0ACA9L352_9GLOM|nr:11068_t:CDS:2 [Dentiscutata heterogama]